MPACCSNRGRSPVACLNRRQLLKAGAAGTAALYAPSVVVAQGAPIKLGVLLPRQGAFAQQGEAAALGLRIALEQFGNEAMGRPVSLVSYDSPSPLDAQQNMRKL